MNEIMAPKRRGPKTKAQKAAEAAAFGGVGDAPSDAAATVIPERAATRQPVRESSREPVRETLRSGEVVGRDGSILSRTRAGAGNEDIMEINPADIPAGWEYQWNTISVYNEPMLGTQNTMYANGWRAVPADRHPGVFTPLGHTGDIVHHGARLEERPKTLGDEARMEDMRRAQMQMTEQQAIMMAKGRDKSPLGDGMSMDGQRYRGVAPQVRRSFAPEEAPRPSYSRE